jgi:hypothetical protein
VLVVGVALGVVVPAGAASAGNDCNALGRQVGTTHGDVKDVWTGCDAFGIQIRAYAGGSAYNYAFKRASHPVLNVIYSTSTISGSSPTWRACSYLGDYPDAWCTNTAYQLANNFSGWRNDTTWATF